MKCIEDFKDIHDGRRLFIMASGPSINDLDLEPLSRRMVMGLNRSFMVYPNSHYHCTFDHRLFDLYPEELRKMRYLFTLEDRPWGIPVELLGGEGYSWDLSEGIYSGYTIAYFALQVAVYMGFKEIFYLGLDLQHKDGQTHFFGHDHHSSDHETSEFPKMRRSFNRVATLMKQRGIQVYNCSTLSTLQTFPFCSYEDALAR